ncbi:hypothetical protein ASF27_17085 [Methylobacterium sp. Leaf102]|uniref:hypothetical protein n=1 Tax=Methylobacterium sp. Leaf102 TaxID=1736253 RepID=UPI0006F8E5A7|nr:hypothetical protein [Methylobacterium sp. Leaf102]KQP32951.1 hypothetical protein ASF27_17085 [Methylobacterium sp. Leaf102]
MAESVDRDWVREAGGGDPGRTPVLVETEIWSRAFWRDPDALAWLAAVGPRRTIVTQTTVREISFGAQWRRRGAVVRPEYDAVLREYAERLPDRYPYLNQSSPRLISTIEGLRVDVSLKSLWITDERNEKPKSPGRLEMSGSSIYLGIPIAALGGEAYRKVARAGHPLPLVFDPLSGVEYVRDGRCLVDEEA